MARSEAAKQQGLDVRVLVAPRGIGVMVGRIALHCPHVAHHFNEAGCLSMSGEELEAIGETCPGLRGTYA